MIIGLNWDYYDNQVISNPQVIAYKSPEGEITRLPDIQFNAHSVQSGNYWYPVVLGYDPEIKRVFNRGFRPFNNDKKAFEFAKQQVEDALQGEWEDGKLTHWVLNGWAWQIAQNLKLVEIGT